MRRRLKKIKCGYCKKWLQPKKLTSKYCSKECQNKARRKEKLKRPPSSKKCTKCKEIKKSIKFHFSNKSFDLLQSWCKDCQRKKNRKRVLVDYECEICHQIFSRIAKSSKFEKTRKKICNLCANRKIIKDNGGHTLNYTGTIHFSGRTIGGWKHSAKRRGHKWEISNKHLEEIYDIQRGLCALSGIKMAGEKKDPFRPSIDRKDSDKGYLIDNVQFVCSVINVMKNKLSDDRFIELCKKIANYNRRSINEH